MNLRASKQTRIDNYDVFEIFVKQKNFPTHNEIFIFVKLWNFHEQIMTRHLRIILTSLTFLKSDTVVEFSLN